MYGLAILLEKKARLGGGGKKEWKSFDFWFHFLVFPPTLACFSVFGFLQFEYNMCMYGSSVVFVLVITMRGILWASWICGFVSVINFGNFSTIISPALSSLFFLIKDTLQPWLVCLSGWSASLWTKVSPVWFTVREHAWVAGQVPSSGHMRCNHTLMFLSLSPSLPLSL